MQQLNTVKPEARLIPCCHCNGTGKPSEFAGYIAQDGSRRCYCGNTGFINVAKLSCCSCGELDSACRCEI